MRIQHKPVRKRPSDGGNDKGNGEGRTRFECTGSRQHEDACADDRPDSEHG